MLKQIRSFSSGVGTKILLTIIIVSFAIWGVGDMVRQSGHNVTLATVGSEKISQSEYMVNLRQENEHLKQALGANYSPQMVKQLDLETYVLQRLLNEKLLGLQSEALGIRASDKAVAKIVQTTPTYQDKNGKFSRQYFDQVLKAKGMSEKTFIENLREEIGSNFILDTITHVPTLPANAAEVLLAAHEQQRNIALYTLTPALAGSAPAPTQDELEAYYKTHIAQFTVPEYRTISYVTYTADDVKKETKISPEALQKAYNERIDDYKTPERRTIIQMIFDNKDAAQKASDEVKGGKKFEDVAKASHIQNKDSLLVGTMEQAKAPQAAADEIFALAKGSATQPVQTPFGWNVFGVKEILPPGTLTLAEVHDDLERELLQNENEGALSKLGNKLEDAMAGGSTLQEAATSLGLKTITLPPINKEGKNESGSVPKDFPVLDKFLDTAFKTDEKYESGLVTSKGANYYIVRVESVKPEHARPLDEVKAAVVSGAQKQWQIEKLANIAKDAAADFAPDKREATTAKYHLPAPTSVTIKRTDDTKKFPAYALDEIFKQPVGGATAALPVDNGNFIIAVVKAIVPGVAADKEKSLAEIRKQSDKDLQNEITSQYLRYLATKFPVWVNEKALAIKSDE